MLRYPAPLERVIREFERLPGIGPKSAQRLALHLMRMDPADVEALGNAVLGLRPGLRECEECGSYTAERLCPICADPSRDRAALCVVEQPSDLMALERAGEFEGYYHVLGGVLSPLGGVGPGDLRIAGLLERVGRLQLREVILATSPTVEGDATAEYLRSLLDGKGPVVSRIALGLPVGGDLDYADQVTVARALRGRRPMEG
jgi:recombination protein RecR